METSGVLLVESDPRLARCLAFELGRAGYRVRTAADGPAAARELATTDFAVLLADLGGARASALFEALRERSRRGRPGPGAVFLTAFPTEDTVLDCLEAGASRVLSKPCAAAELLSAVAAAREEGRRLGEAETEQVRGFRGFRGWVELTVPGRGRHLARLETFIALLYGTTLPAATKDALRTAVTEVVANALEWGSAGRPGRKIRISYCYLPEEIVLKVEDEGPGFDPEQVPDPTLDPVAHLHRREREGKRSGGYGLFIVRQLMDRVIHSQRGNVVLLAKRLERPAGQAEPRKG